MCRSAPFPSTCLLFPSLLSLYRPRSRTHPQSTITASCCPDKKVLRERFHLRGVVPRDCRPAHGTEEDIDARIDRSPNGYLYLDEAAYAFPLWPSAYRKSILSRGIRRMKRVKNILLLDRLLFIVRKMVDEVRAFCRGKIMKFCRDRVVMYLLHFR